MHRAMELLKKGKGITEESRATYLESNKPYISLFLTAHCSHNCWFCLSGKPSNAELDSIIDNIGVDKYIEIVLHLAGSKKATYILTGGEPTEHRSFEQILKTLLLKGHDVLLQTNGSDVSKVKKVMEEIGSEYYEHLGWEMSFHLAQYMKEASPSKRMEKWMANFRDVVNNSRDVSVIVVATPDLLKSDDAESVLDALTATRGGGCVRIQELYGNFEGLSYPTAYTLIERERLNFLADKYKHLMKNKIDSLAQVNRVLYLKGMPCFYMTRLRAVSTRGKIVMCSSGLPNCEYPITNYKAIPALEDSPRPCIYDSCNCVSMGYLACLIPNNITLEEYLEAIK